MRAGGYGGRPSTLAYRGPSGMATANSSQKKKETFEVKIIKSSKSTYWYNERIGEVYYVHEYSKYSYSLVESSYLIDKCDCIRTDSFRNEIDKILDI